MSNSIVNFLEGIGTDSRNRHIDEILDEDNRYWEHTHDFIQWLFPLNEGRALKLARTDCRGSCIDSTLNELKGLKAACPLSIIFIKNNAMEKPLQPQSSPHHQGYKVFATANG